MIPAGRPQDVEDVRGLVAGGTPLDEQEIVGILENLETALGEAGLVSRWHQVRG